MEAETKPTTEESRRMFMPDDATPEQKAEYDAALKKADAENDMLLAAEKLLKAHGYTVYFDHGTTEEAGLRASDIPLDWRTVRNILLAVKPDWKPRSGDEETDDSRAYQFCELVIRQTMREMMRETCSHCKSKKWAWEFYRCWDCKAYLCEGCIKHHFGAGHIPHPKTIEQFETELAALRRLSQREADGAAPIDMILYCPRCHLQHVDGEEPGRPTFDGREIGETAPWLNPPHRSHLCHGCGFIWRPADVPTNGVEAIKTKGKADNEPAPPHPDSARERALEKALRTSRHFTKDWFSKSYPNVAKELIETIDAALLSPDRAPAQGGNGELVKELLSRAELSEPDGYLMRRAAAALSRQGNGVAK